MSQCVVCAMVSDFGRLSHILLTTNAQLAKGDVKLFRRDKRFIPERHSIGTAGYIRAAGFGVLCVVAAFGAIKAGQALWQGLNTDIIREITVLEPMRQGWKRFPEDAGGTVFLNKGLEINLVQAELFEAPSPDEIILAPPPDDF